MTKKLCPIPISNEYGVSYKDECEEEKCAWWVKWQHSGACAIPRLVEVLHPETLADYKARLRSSGKKEVQS